MLRPTGGNNYTVVGITSPQTVAAGQTGTFSVSIPVQAGDVIGERAGVWHNCALLSSGGNVLNSGGAVTAPTLGSTVSLPTVNAPDMMLNMSVTFAAGSASAVPVPTLSGWGLLTLGLVLAGSAGVRLRRQRA